MTDMEQQRKARKKALRLLEHMDRTEKGLTDRLLRAGFSEELAEDAVSYVKDYGYINDRRYALNYIMYRIHDKSRQKIFQELSGKGIDRQTIQDTWEEAEELETPDERALLRQMVGKKVVYKDALGGFALGLLTGVEVSADRGADISITIAEVDGHAI